MTIARSRARDAADPEKARERKRKWREENREKHNAINRAWNAKNQHVKTAHEGKRRAAKLLRTPKWLTADDLFIIEEAYD